ncbi:hypothetical protein FRC09_008527 [Ceratobasidium sp. 395]|nr:hypothetical protein FRC09_008527 [Ceratobasidium sp. 395]
MAARPWLHPPLARESVYQEKLVEFCVLHFPKMSTDDFNGQIRLIEQAPFHNSKRLIVWLETLAGKIVLGCPPEQSLQICMSLCKKVLSSQSLQVHDKQMAETRLALWWIFLNCTFDCSHSSWPGNNYYDSHSGTIVETDSLLTLTHLRDSRKRETQSCWLAITGVSASPDHHSGPHHEANHKHFGEIIKILYAAICTPALSDENDQFMGTLPVYRGTEVRLYEFDSLDFCLDALTTATGSSCYDAFSSPLNNLVSQVQVLKDIKQAQASFERDPSNLTRIILQYQNSLYTDRHPELWMAAGLFHRLPTLIDHICSISGGLRFVSRLIADLFFGFPPNVAVSVTLPDSSDELSTKMAACLPWMLVLWWAWAPFGELLESGWTTQEVATKSPPRSRFLWKIIRDIGLLHMECSPDPYVRLENYTLLSIKAGLLEKLYSFPPNGSDSPDQLEWSLALSKQVYRLLQFWWAGPEEHSVDDQAFIITSLSKLLEFLVNANCQTRLDSDRNLAIQPTNVIANGVRDTSNAATSAYTQLDLLVAAGALQKLGLPFSQEFRATRLSSSDIPDENKWRNRLVEIIDKVARVDPQLAAFRGRIPYPDIIEFYTGLPEGHDRRTEMLNIVTALSSYMTEIREASGRQDSVEPS